VIRTTESSTQPDRLALWSLAFGNVVIAIGVSIAAERRIPRRPP